ncbi:MAG TPA: efflux RND transporter periplasmic adaptor subunit [Verrucomicrobiae bacterium]
MTPDKLQSLRIPAEAKDRSQKSVWLIFLLVAAAAGVALFFAWPRESDKVRTAGDKAAKATSNKKDEPIVAVSSSNVSTAAVTPAAKSGASLLTVSGYIINRERIEISPRFMGMVTWIGVKKGDVVTNGQVVVLLDNSEYKARLAELNGKKRQAQVALEKAQIWNDRVKQLSTENVESKQVADDARLAVEAARGTIEEIDGMIAGLKNYLDWCVIKSPINGVVLEKLVDPNELVTPQSFGGTRGPSTALIAVADLNDLQVEIDLNEADVAKDNLNQKCKVSPEAYPDRIYDGYVAEKAPEANRQKGTLQLKVQIQNPDQYLTPELSAKVDFLKPAELSIAKSRPQQ